MKAKHVLPLLTLGLLLVLVFPGTAFANEALVEALESGTPLGDLLPLWSIIPFVGMLLSIAICPLVCGEWWEEKKWIAVAFWSLLLIVPFTIAFGVGESATQLVEKILLDYVPFITLLLGLFVVSGGIVLRGNLAGSPKVNCILLLIGTLLASWIGTTGASMLLIRPLLRANHWRKKKSHVVIFFIFLVSNIGGCLTPVGDPPLFLGFLRGVPFFWTMRLAPVLLLNAAVLFVVFFLLDRRNYRKELAAGNRPPEATGEKLSVGGLHNLVFLGIIVGAVILSGILAAMPAFQDATGAPAGIRLFNGLVFPWTYVIEVGLFLLAAVLSNVTTKKSIRKENNFNYAPIVEVATLFIGIFITMIPALAILSAKGANLGLNSPWQFFWATGILSSFLDNAPTYLVFMTTAGSLGQPGLATAVGSIAPTMLMAVSCGAVFMGANTYIGNAPNFMVKSIAESDSVKMPSFFGYMGWSAMFLLPLFVIDTLIFFL